MELGNMIFGNSRGEYEVDRGWQDIFITLLDELKMDYHGEEYENDTFAVFPYYWGDCECPEDIEHKPDCLAIKPNFLYKPTGFEIKWYKYPFRDSYMNQNIKRSEFMKIVQACIDSIK